MKKQFKPLIVTSLILIYLVIAAGAVVRMTGSGMGCPDWPKCFGYLIPPTERNQLEWKANHKYNEGQVIILNESLRVASTDFTSSARYQTENWEAYTKHDYAVFNPTHTWIEFINRLLGALAGLATLLLFVSSLWRIKSDVISTVLSFLIVLGMGFQGWLGKTVVDSNLLPFKITIHMAMALVLVLILIILLAREKQLEKILEKSTTIQRVLVFGLFLTLIQIAMGTQVRQFVDEQMHAFNLEEASAWLTDAPLLFYLHRSFSLLVLLVHGYLGYLLFQKKILPNVFTVILFLLVAEILTGIWMYYFDFPFSSQPLHLVLASLLFGAQSYFILTLKKQL
jgi:cytochrome c oxidase assembly protein subunit 15